MGDLLALAGADRLRALLAEATAGPWEYRPQEYDDWGFIRGPVREFDFGMIGPIVAISREGGTESDHDKHRRDKTDPYEPNGRLIVAAVNALPGLLDERDALRAENEKLRKAVVGQWFYPADGWDQEACHYSPDEVIDYHDLAPGKHIVEVNVATPLPTIWCAVTVTDDEDADERYTFTEHATEEDARAAIEAAGDVGEGS